MFVVEMSTHNILKVFTLCRGGFVCDCRERERESCMQRSALLGDDVKYKVSRSLNHVRLFANSCIRIIAFLSL